MGKTHKEKRAERAALEAQRADANLRPWSPAAGGIFPGGRSMEFSAQVISVLQPQLGNIPPQPGFRSASAFYSDVACGAASSNR